MLEPIGLPGLVGKTVVVIDAGDDHGPAVCVSLLASGSTVIATGSASRLPPSLVDAGTGLPGELHYRPLDGTDWADVAEWIGSHAGTLHGIVGSSDAVVHAAAALASVLVADASTVSVGLHSSATSSHPRIRSNAIVLAGGRGTRPEDAGSAIAFLLSDLAERIDGATIPIGERPAALI